MKKQFILALVLLIALCRPVFADETPLHVELDTSEVPHLSKWGEDAKDLIIRWYPRVRNLLPTKGVNPPRTITLKLLKSDKWIGATLGNTIIVSSPWIEKYPDDVGLVFHFFSYLLSKASQDA